MLTIHFGSSKMPLQLGPNSITCFILANKQRVFTKESFQKALGYGGKSENWLFKLLTNLTASLPAYSELPGLYGDSVSVQTKEAKEQNSVVSTFGSELLSPICQVITKAQNEGLLKASEMKFAKAAALLLENLGDSKIDDLIDEATGFVRYKEIALESVIQLLQQQQQDDAYLWIKTIPKMFLDTILEINNLDWIDVKQHPKNLCKIMHEIIFSRIDDLLLDEMRFTKPKRSYKRKDNKKQDLELPELKEYIASVLSLIKVSGNDWNIFLQLLNKSFPKQKNRAIMHFFEHTENRKPLSSFNEKLKKSFNTDRRKL